ncbi:hypothetical protein EES39_26865 [Streptomyces sp. ADI92-24]|nr:hypothetical protein EES39_26865 [Streptomyces sp. ADI92-24]
MPLAEDWTGDAQPLGRDRVEGISPTSAATAAACTADPATKGCRVLEYLYPLTTTATDTEFGDVVGRVKSIRLWATEPGTTTLASAGASVAARTWTVNEYDAGRPTDGTATVMDQITKVTFGAQVREHPSVQGENRVDQPVYDWVKGLPTKTIKDPGGLAITETTEYDDQGRTAKQLLPGATGTACSTGRSIRRTRCRRRSRTPTTRPSSRAVRPPRQPTRSRAPSRPPMTRPEPW